DTAFEEVRDVVPTAAPRPERERDATPRWRISKRSPAQEAAGGRPEEAAHVGDSSACEAHAVANWKADRLGPCNQDRPRTVASRRDGARAERDDVCPLPVALELGREQPEVVPEVAAPFCLRAASELYGVPDASRSHHSQCRTAFAELAPERPVGSQT